LDVLFLEHFGGFVEEVVVYPVGDCPVFFWDYICEVVLVLEEREWEVGGLYGSGILLLSLLMSCV